MRNRISKYYSYRKGRSRFEDVIKRDLEDFNIETSDWSNLSSDRSVRSNEEV